MNMKELLWKIRQHLAKPSKWVKNAYHKEDGSCCLLGALEDVTDRKALRNSDVAHKLANALGVDGPAGIIQFNDSSETRHRDVIRKLDEAMHNCKSDEQVL